MNTLFANPADPLSWLSRFEADEAEASILLQQSLIITAHRGTGKRTLVRKVLHQLEGKKNTRCFEINLYETSSLSEMIATIARNTLGLLDTNHLKLMRELSNYFNQLRPVIEYDAGSGSPVINFNLDQNYKAAHTLEQIFTYLDRLNVNIVLAFIEFQRVLEYRETNAAALISDLVPRFSNIKIIYTTTPSVRWKQFLQSDNGKGYTNTKHFNLQPAEHEHWKGFIIDRFAEVRCKLTDEVADHLLDWCRLHTATIVTVCNRMIGSGIKHPDEWQLERILQEIFIEQEAVFYTYRRLLTLNQWLLLKGIAREKGAKQVMGSSFVKNHDMGSASSVQTALLAMYDKEMVYEQDGLLYLTDTLLSRWLER